MTCRHDPPGGTCLVRAIGLVEFEILPCSISIMMATEVAGFVMQAMLKIASTGSGVLPSSVPAARALQFKHGRPLLVYTRRSADRGAALAPAGRP